MCRTRAKLVPEIPQGLHGYFRMTLCQIVCQPLVDPASRVARWCPDSCSMSIGAAKRAPFEASVTQLRFGRSFARRADPVGALLD